MTGSNNQDKRPPKMPPNAAAIGEQWTHVAQPGERRAKFVDLSCRITPLWVCSTNQAEVLPAKSILPLLRHCFV